MKTIFTIIFILLAYTCWLWPILFIKSLLECIDTIVKKEKVKEKSFVICVLSLICMNIAPFIIALLVTA